jgi:predicted nucleic acid-binding protein
VNLIVLLDNEAVQALGSPAHRKHRRVLGELDIASRRIVRGLPLRVAVPTTVRVEAGWDRTSSAWAFANRLPIADIPLEARQANTAAGIRERTGVSVADAHLGAAIQAAVAGNVTVVTSDPRDIRRVAEGRRVDVVTI